MEYMSGLYNDLFTVHISIYPSSYHISKNKLGCPAVMKYMSGLFHDLFTVHIQYIPVLIIYLKISWDVQQ